MNKTVCVVMILALALTACFSGVSEVRAESSAEASKFVGVWLFQNENTLIKATFTKAGRFTQTTRTAEGEENTQGKYSIVSDKLVARPDGSKDPLRFNFRFIDNNQLELTDDAGLGVRMVRQVDPQTDKPAADSSQGAPSVKANIPAKTTSAKTGKAPATATATISGKRPATMVFRPFTEPREKAFTALMPKGWKVEGGILRLSPDAVGAHNATDAKADITLKRDDSGTLQMR
ncbi:MAG: DUF6705 family protein [Armatimonadota bacterium]